MNESFERQFDRVFRAPAMLALGMLVSQIPKISIKVKNNERSERLSTLVNAIGFIISAVAFIYLAYLPVYTTFKAHLFTCLVCPAFLYFATALPIYSKFLNLLGEISIFVYLAQCPILIHHYAVSRDTRDQFPLLCICTIAMFVINRVVNTIINKKKATT
jgi:peptidoglycan/LPS O-acetylase OafA/YrhL